jgi:hypothetical protein
MVGLVILSVRRGGWRYPAYFAIVIALVGGVNATSILLAGLAPVLWIFYAVWITKEVSARRALAAVLRLGVLSLGVSLWWIAGLWAEGVYGLNILKFTETVPTVTSTSLSSEVVRGLGYWYFYGQDKLQPWTSAAIPYMQSGWMIGVSFAVPALCAIVGAVARWRYRAFAVGLILIGVIAAVAAYPFDGRPGHALDQPNRPVDRARVRTPPRRRHQCDRGGPPQDRPARPRARDRSRGGRPASPVDREPGGEQSRSSRAAALLCAGRSEVPEHPRHRPGVGHPG